MKTLTKLLLLAACLPGAARAADTDPIAKVEVNAQRDPEWIGYRRAYKAAAFFAPFVRTRPLIQAHLQVRPLRAGLPLDGLRLTVAGARTRFEVAVDAIGRAELPMEKQAYQDDAVMTLNRQKGHYYFSGRYSIRERDDGVYDAGMLREACEQLLAAQRASGYRMRLIGKQCAGIKFVYPASAGAAAAPGAVPGAALAVVPGTAPTVASGAASATVPGTAPAAVPGAAPELVLESGGAPPRKLAPVLAHPFEDVSMDQYQVVIVRFSELPAGARVSAAVRPLAIGTLYE